MEEQVGEEEESNRTCLNEEAKKEDDRVLFTDLIGGHGPWQFRLWVLFFVGSLCNVVQLFSFFPIASPDACNCTLNAAEHLQSVKCIDDDDDDCLTSENTRHLEEHCSYQGFFQSEQDLLLCKNTQIMIYSKIIYGVCCWVSGFVTPLIISRYSRRLFGLVNSIVLFSFAIAIGFTKTPVIYLLHRIVITLGITNFYLLSAISLLENASEEYRFIYFSAGHISWGLAHFTVPLLVWLIKDWTHFCIVISMLCLVIIILTYFIPESFECYIFRGLWDDAEKLVKRAASANGYCVEKLNQADEKIFGRKNSKNGQLTKIPWNKENLPNILHPLLLFLMGISSAFMYFTSIWLSEWRTKKRGQYLALMGTSEIAAILILLFSSSVFSARRLWASATALASLLFVAIYFKTNTQVAAIPTLLYINLMFFTFASWTMVLYKLLYQLTLARVEWKTIAIGVGICIGILAASLTDLQKFHYWNRKQFLFYGIPNLLLSIGVGFAPEKYLTF